MPSIEESKRQVKAGLNNAPEIDHDAILASLQDEIDRHNTDGSESKPRRHRKRRDSDRSRDDAGHSMRFRFKSHVSEKTDSKKRKHRSREEPGHGHRWKKEHRHKTTSDDGGEEAAHPFPREPTNPDVEGNADANAAFRDSLFDALADDEGAAYWESVYSQPIHIYERPTVKTARGGLEEMNDDEYAAYVQTKMWEKKNPEIVLERERTARQRKEEEEERKRQREEFIRRKERAAWEKAQKSGAKRFAGVDDNDDYEYVFDFDDRNNSRSKRSEPERDEYPKAWAQYNIAWDRLKLELLDEAAHAGETDDTRQAPSKRIPWPVLQPKPVTRPNIEDFMRHISVESDGKSRLQLLKTERFKWHPDKVQQRFAGSVDEGTMKIVTGVFQVVDALVEEERKRG